MSRAYIPIADGGAVFFNSDGSTERHDSAGEIVEISNGEMSVTIGVHVDYRFWESPENQDWQTGVVQGFWTGVHGSTTYVDVKRDGYRETAVLPIAKIAPATFRVH